MRYAKSTLSICPCLTADVLVRGNHKSGCAVTSASHEPLSTETVVHKTAAALSDEADVLHALTPLLYTAGDESSPTWPPCMLQNPRSSSSFVAAQYPFLSVVFFLSSFSTSLPCKVCYAKLSHATFVMQECHGCFGPRTGMYKNTLGTSLMNLEISNCMTWQLVRPNRSAVVTVQASQCVHWMVQLLPWQRSIPHHATLTSQMYTLAGLTQSEVALAYMTSKKGSSYNVPSICSTHTPVHLILQLID